MADGTKKEAEKTMRMSECKRAATTHRAVKVAILGSADPVPTWLIESRDFWWNRYRELEAAETLARLDERKQDRLTLPADERLELVELKVQELRADTNEKIAALEAQQATHMNVESGLEILGDHFEKHSHLEHPAGPCFW